MHTYTHKKKLIILGEKNGLGLGVQLSSKPLPRMHKILDLIPSIGRKKKTEKPQAPGRGDTCL